MAKFSSLPVTMTAISLVLAVAFLGSACAPVATPEVIQYTSVPSRTPPPTRVVTAGPPTAVPTPYTRPTDDPGLNLNLPIVRVGDEVITLGQFRARVRYERFAALDNARRLIERVGLDKLNLAQPGENPTADTVASVFNTLASADTFGRQVYDIMVREAVIRQEFKARGLKVDPKDVRDYWVRYLDLQKAPDIEAALPGAQDAYLKTASLYSGLPREAISTIFEGFVMALDLRPIIGKERVGALSVVQVKVRRLIAKTQADGDTVIAQIKGGADFRTLVCQYTVEAAARGSSDLGYVTRGQFIAGLQGADAVFNSHPGDIVGPLQSPLGWHLFRIRDQRKNADGDTQVDVQTILVATQQLAMELRDKAKAGEDFDRLACLNSLDKTSGTHGDLGWVDPLSLGDTVAQAMENLDGSQSNQNSNGTGLVGPVATSRGFEIILVDDRRANIPKPEEMSQAESQAFSAWQSEKVNSTEVVTLNSTWKQAIPADPLPRDVSPWMREENFGLPTPQPGVGPATAKAS